MRIAIFLSALGFSSLAIAAIKVDLKLDDPMDPKALVIDSNDAKCGGTQLNCIEVAHGTSPNIVFNLPNACGSGASDPQYRLSSMRITLINKVWPTNANPLNEKVAADFNADPNTGRIDFLVGNNKQTKSKLRFKNKNRNEYTVFYEITAVHCDDSSDANNISLDPEIRNKGNS